MLKRNFTASVSVLMLVLSSVPGASVAAAASVQLGPPDTVTVSVLDVRSPLPVALPTVTTQAARDWFDRLALIASLVVAPIFALRAAQVGEARRRRGEKVSYRGTRTRSGSNLAAMWDSFVRRRDAVMLLAEPDLEHEVETFYEWLRCRHA